MSQDWQPIDTAPCDNSQFLALLPSGRVTIARWEEDSWSKKPRPYFALAGFGSPRISDDRASQPVGWMPLPKVSA